MAESDLSFDKSFELALASESTDLNAKDLQATKSPQTSHNRMQIKQAKPCYHCGGNHKAIDCPHKSSECHKCGKKGHLACVCRSKKPVKKEPRPRQDSINSRPTHVLTEDTDEYFLYNLNGSAVQPLVVTVKVNNVDLKMELDTGASVSIISEATYNRLWPQGQAPVLQESHVKLKTYSGEQVAVKGVMDVTVQVNEQTKQLPLVVACGNGPSLLGRDWLMALKLDWTQLCANHVCSSLSLQGILDEHSSIFDSKLGALNDTTVTVHLDPTAQPRFCKARTVPYTLKEKIEKELDHLVEQGVIEPICYSEWAAPIVPVLKKDGTVRICGDYKLTVNQAAKINSYPLPKISDLFASLAGGQTFSKLDLANAYLQIPLDEASQKLVTINTH